MKNIYMIVAMTKKTRAIGYQNAMLYHLPKDLQYFKEKTAGHTVVMGYHTYMSLPRRPLPNRKNIILSRSDRKLEGAFVYHNVDEILEYAKNRPEEKIFIIGGDSIYHQFLPYADSLYITMIEEDDEVPADTFFPEIKDEEWILKEESDRIKDGNPEFYFTLWERR